VRSILDIEVINRGLGGLVFSERKNENPFLKDYDADEDEGPVHWGKKWNLSNWGVISAYLHDSRVGGCVIAFDTPGVDMLEGRKDIAVLWDLRVHPNHRTDGIGSKLFQAAVTWARERDCRQLKVETQNINVPACRFYARHGCTLGVVNQYAYIEYPDEVELIWYKDL
jgi:GNAT superfamily N-acetyltransferase